MKSKRVYGLLLAGAVLLAAPVPVSAEPLNGQKATIIVDGLIRSLNQDAYVQGDIFYVPVRSLMEELGYEVGWVASQGRISVSRPGSPELLFTPGSSEAVINARTVDFKEPFLIIGDTAYMPARAILERLGFQVDTNGHQGRFYIKSPAWYRISAALKEGGSSVRVVEKRSGTGSGTEAEIYLDGELVYAGGWDGRSMNGTGIVYDQGIPVYEGELRSNIPNGWGIRHDRNGDRYEGSFQEGLPQGDGRWYVKKRLVYSGDWVLGRMEGNGKLYGSEGATVYEGSFNNGFRQGYGVLFDEAGGKVYDGSWEKDAPSGTGRSYNKEGKVEYSGQWKDGVKHGSGSIHRYGKVKSYDLDGTSVVSFKEVDTLYVKEVEYENGILVKESDREYVYRGTFADTGILNGTGEAGIVEGTILSEAGLLNDWRPYYKGDFKLGKMKGNGSFYNESGTIIYEGQVEDGKRQGDGVLFENGKVAYHGPWVKDLRHGSGWNYRYDSIGSSGQITFTMTSAAYSNGSQTGTGDVYRVTGALTTEKLTGVATQIWIYDAAKKTVPVGTYWNTSAGVKVYEGAFVNGVREGQGKEFLPDGGTYTGSFKANERSGQGKLVIGNYTYEGEFVNNRKEGKGKLYLNGILIYEGEFKNDQKHGSGITYSNGVKEYDGQFANDKKNGYGILFNYSGTIIYQGEFKDDMTITAYRALHPQ